MFAVYLNGIGFTCCRFAAAQEAAQQRAGRDKAMGQHPPGQPEKRGPSSLFIFSEDNVVRRYTRFIIEWPYPLHTPLYFFLLINCFENLFSCNLDPNCLTRERNSGTELTYFLIELRKIGIFYSFVSVNFENNL